MIILVGGTKGGTGKTTLATNLVAMRKLAGHDVLLVDTDPQSSSNYWAEHRNDLRQSLRVPCVQKSGQGVTEDLKDLATRYKDIVVDAGGHNSIELRAALLAVDKIIIPTQASQFDVWAITLISQLVEASKVVNPTLLAGIVISRASTHPSAQEIVEAQDLFKEFNEFEVLTSVIRDRVAYRKAARGGQCIIELNPEDKKASDEIKGLYAEVFGDGEFI